MANCHTKRAGARIPLSLVGNRLRPLLEARRRCSLSCLSASRGIKEGRMLSYSETLAAPRNPSPRQHDARQWRATDLARLGLWRRAVRHWDRPALSVSMPEMLPCNPTKPQSAQHRAQNTVCKTPCTEHTSIASILSGPWPCWTLDASGLQQARRLSSGRMHVAHVIPSALHPDDPGLLISLGAPITPGIRLTA